MKTLLGAILFAAAAPLAAGEIAYRWVDEHGVTHFSDQPPPEAVEAETLSLPEYAIPVTPMYSYVALLDRLRAMEEELEAARRDNARQETVIVPYPVRESDSRVVYSTFPHALPPHFVRPPGRPVPDVQDPRNTRSRFDRLFESRRGPSDPPPQRD